MSQPVWKLIAQLGDADPITYGGYFIYEDETGVYAPEAEWLEVEEDADYDEPRDGKWTIFRFSLDKCTYINGILSDNEFHPEMPAWWAGTEEERKERPQDSTYLNNLADFNGQEGRLEDFALMFCDENPLTRAHAYRVVGEYHGFEHLDDYPLKITRREELEERYEGKCDHKVPNEFGYWARPDENTNAVENDIKCIKCGREGRVTITARDVKWK